MGVQSGKFMHAYKQSSTGLPASWQRFLAWFDVEYAAQMYYTHKNVMCI